MAASWSAKGLLKPLWGRVGGRDGLAALTGIPGPDLSGINTGRLNLGQERAERIAQVLSVSLTDLGAPGDDSIVSRLERIEDRLPPADLETQIADQLRKQAGLLATLSELAAGLKEAVQLLGDVAERLDSATAVRPAPRRTRKPA